MDRPYSNKQILHERYEIERVIGQGSYGITYVCIDSRDKRRCVVKQMRRTKRKESTEMIDREINILRKLDHPNIPNLIDIFTFQKEKFIVMEYMKGHNLEELIFHKTKTFSEKESLLLIKQLVLTIDYIHKKGVAHGDIRIPNVILNDADVYLIDFGLANSDHTDKEAAAQDDFYDLGDFLLFLLYSSHDSISKKDRPWTEELTLSEPTVILLKRLLSINQPYRKSSEVLIDIEKAIATLTN